MYVFVLARSALILQPVNIANLPLSPFPCLSSNNSSLSNTPINILACRSRSILRARLVILHRIENVPFEIALLLVPMYARHFIITHCHRRDSSSARVIRERRAVLVIFIASAFRPHILQRRTPLTFQSASGPTLGLGVGCAHMRFPSLHYCRAVVVRGQPLHDAGVSLSWSRT